MPARDEGQFKIEAGLPSWHEPFIKLKQVGGCSAFRLHTKIIILGQGVAGSHDEYGGEGDLWHLSLLQANAELVVIIQNLAPGYGGAPAVGKAKVDRLAKL